MSRRGMARPAPIDTPAMKVISPNPRLHDEQQALCNAGPQNDPLKI